jgi:hypothetical protein
VSTCLERLAAQGALVRQGRRIIVVAEKLGSAHLNGAENLPKKINSYHEAQDGVR